MPEECIDPIARELAHKAQRFAGEVGSVVWGDHERRDNGIRSVSRRNTDRIDAVESDVRLLRSELRHYLDAGRLATCYGIAALKLHEATCEAEEEEETEVKIAEIQAGATRAGASWQSIAMIVGQVLTLVGVLIVALK